MQQLKIISILSLVLLLAFSVSGVPIDDPESPYTYVTQNIEITHLAQFSSYSNLGEDTINGSLMDQYFSYPMFLEINRSMNHSFCNEIICQFSFANISQTAIDNDGDSVSNLSVYYLPLNYSENADITRRIKDNPQFFTNYTQANARPLYPLSALDSFQVNGGQVSIEENNVARGPFLVELKGTSQISDIESGEAIDKSRFMTVAGHKHRGDILTRDITYNEPPESGKTYCPFVFDLGDWPERITVSQFNGSTVSDSYEFGSYTYLNQNNKFGPYTDAMAITGENYTLMLSRPEDLGDLESGESFFFTMEDDEQDLVNGSIAGICSPSSENMQMPSGPNAFIFDYNPFNRNSFQASVSKLSRRMHQLSFSFTMQTNRYKVKNYTIAEVRSQPFYPSDKARIKFSLQRQNHTFSNYSIRFSSSMNETSIESLDGQNKVVFDEIVYLSGSHSGEFENWYYPFDRYQTEIEILDKPLLESRERKISVKDSRYISKVNIKPKRIQYTKSLPLGFSLLISILSIFSLLFLGSVLVKRDLEDSIRGLPGIIGLGVPITILTLGTPLLSIPGVISILSLSLFLLLIAYNLIRSTSWVEN